MVTPKPNIDGNIEQLLSEDVSSPNDILKPSPSFLIMIVSTVVKFMESNPDANEQEVLYHSVNSFLKSTMKFVDSGKDISAVFVYYIDAYRALKVYRGQFGEQTSSIPDPKHTVLLNDAALSIFDLYVENSENVVIRRLLPIAAESLREVITVHQTQNENTKVVLGHLSVLALLTQTLGSYLKGHQRDKNFGYVLWLKTFLKKCSSTLDLSFITDDETTKQVIKDVTNNQRIITITD